MNLALLLALALAQSPAIEASDAGAAGVAEPAATTADAAVSSDAGQPAPDDLLMQLEAVLAAPVPDAGAGPSAQKPLLKIGSASLMNPDISVIFDGAAGYASGLPISPSGDDPDLGGDETHRPAGFTLQELELGFQATVDPYFTANVFLTIPNLQGLEVEEAYAQTLSLPWDLQIKAGVFRSSTGRQNEQHLHMQDFSRRPLINAAYLGADGLRGPGAQLSWLVPAPFYLKLAAEAFSLDRSDALTFGGSERTDPTIVASAKAFFPATEELSLLLGVSGATGHSGLEPNSPGDNGPRTWLFGADLYLKWKRPNTTEGYFSVALQAEYYWRRTAATTAALTEAQTDGGLYAQLVAQLSRRWHAGFRYDLLGAPTSALQARVDKFTAMVMFTPSEFSRIRLQGSRQNYYHAEGDWEGLLVLEFSMGAHGAHPF